MPGTVISAPELTHVSKHGLWLLLADEEILLPFEQFPWFRQATIDQISHVEAPTPSIFTGPSSISICRSSPYATRKRFR